MGLFDKVKNVINDAKDQVAQHVAKQQEEEKKRQEEEKKRQEEANRFNPEGKSLQWFSSEDGIKTFREYMTAQNYLLEETLKKEHESRYSEYSFEVFVSVIHKDAKIPYVYFTNLAGAIDSKTLEYVGPTKLLVHVLSEQSKPFYINDDGEPQQLKLTFSPEETVSVNKNPVLHFIKNFNCFEWGDDAQGSWDNKWKLWSSILNWLGAYSRLDKEIVSKNPWIFSKELYFNDFGTVRNPKGFFKKCIELTTEEKHKSYFEASYNECV